MVGLGERPPWNLKIGVDIFWPKVGWAAFLHDISIVPYECDNLAYIQPLSLTPFFVPHGTKILLSSN